MQKIYNEVISKVKYSLTATDDVFRKFIEKDRLYIQDINEIDKRKKLLYSYIKSGQSDMSKICFQTGYGNCDKQAMGVLELGEKYGYKGAIHSRILPFINNKEKVYYHYFSHLSDGKGNKAILDTWAGVFIHNGQAEFKAYYPAKSSYVYDEYLTNDKLLSAYNKGILDKFNFGNMKDDSFDDDNLFKL